MIWRGPSGRALPRDDQARSCVPARGEPQGLLEVAKRKREKCAESRTRKPLSDRRPARLPAWIQLNLDGYCSLAHWADRGFAEPCLRGEKRGQESIRTTLKHYARFVPAVDERNLRLLDEFATQAAEDVSKTCHPGAPR